MTTAASFEIEYLQYLGPDGTLVRDDLPEAGRDIVRLRELFKQMLFVRTFDTKAIALQRTLSKGDWVLTKAAIAGTKQAIQSYFGYGGHPRRPLKRLDKARVAAIEDGVREVMELEKTL